MKGYILGLGAATIAAAGVAYVAKSHFNNKTSNGLVIGGFNMQYGPYKISRIAPNTMGLDEARKNSTLTFNNYCMKKDNTFEKPNNFW